MSDAAFIVAIKVTQGHPAISGGLLAARLGWKVTHAAHGMTIIGEPGLRIVAGDGPDKVWLIGTAFHRCLAGSPVDRIGPELARGAFHEKCTILLDRYWGAFLAIGAAGTAYSVLRDPSAAMPCYYLRIGTSLFITNSVSVLVRAGLLRPRLNWNGIARCLSGNGLPTALTGLEDIEELLPGNLLQFDHQRFRLRAVWSPWDHVAVDRDVDIGSHARRLREVIVSTVAAWSGLFDHVLTTVSGGLDSSIVLSCCNLAGNRVSSVTMSTDDRNGDERRFARLICEHGGTPLTEAGYELADMDIATSISCRLPRPIGRSPALAYDKAVGRVADRLGVDAVFTGNGGDNVFAYSQSAAAIADRAGHDGITTVWPTVRDVCHLTGCNIIEALAAARKISKAGPRYRWKANTQMLDPQLVAAATDRPLEHAWLDAPASALPGKAAHIAGLLRIQQHLDGFHRFAGRTVINPLMSQPVVEACLAIPTWMWCDQGRNRSVARIAFRQSMPASIVHRTSKGGPDGFGMMFLSRFRDEIADRLLNGHLARHRMIDRPAVERRLFSERPDAGAEQVRLLELIDAEAWIDHWRDAAAPPSASSDTFQ